MTVTVALLGYAAAVAVLAPRLLTGTSMRRRDVASVTGGLVDVVAAGSSPSSATA